MYKRNEEGQTVLADRREMLRVKAKSLMAEAMIIRKEEQRTHGELRNELHHHRTMVVRNEARATNLAYGFIRGKTLEQMEPNRKPFSDCPRTAKILEDRLWEKVRSMLKKYGPRGMLEPEVLKKAA